MGITGALGSRAMVLLGVMPVFASAGPMLGVGKGGWVQPWCSPKLAVPVCCQVWGGWAGPPPCRGGAGASAVCMSPQALVARCRAAVHPHTAARGAGGTPGAANGLSVMRAG